MEENMENKNKKENGLAIIESQDIFERFEQLDDKVIIQLLEDQVAEAWVYHFKQEGKDIWGIGKAGIDGCAKEMGKKGIALREDSVDFMIDPTHPEFVLFTAKVSKHVVDEKGNEAMVESAIGTKRQWIMLKRRSDQKLVSNKFWFEQGSQKALRNAKARLIPDDIKAKILAFAQKKGRVREIEPPAKTKKEPLPPEPGDDGIADMASQGPGSEEFKTIPITIKGKTTMASKFEMLDRFGEAKEVLGKIMYYKVLGEHGYVKSNEIPDKDIPKIYYAMLDADEVIKMQVKKAAEKKKEPEKESAAEEKKPAVFPGDEEKEPETAPEETEGMKPEMPTQAEIMELTKLEVILVDKHDFTPDQVIGKIKEMFGADESTKLTKEQNREAIEWFKDAIEQLNKAK
jgi:hypothetical protein